MVKVAGETLSNSVTPEVSVMRLKALMIKDGFLERISTKTRFDLRIGLLVNKTTNHFFTTVTRCLCDVRDGFHVSKIQPPLLTLYLSGVPFSIWGKEKRN